MKAVCNAGPLIALGKLDLVFVLRHLYDEIWCPSAVYEEVVVQGLDLGHPDAYVVERAVRRGLIVVKEVPPEGISEVVQSLPIGRGEKQTIHLALVESADWVLMDDLLAREKAEKLGLRVKGTLGVIVDAYRRQVISLGDVELAFHSIMEREDIWIAKPLVQRVWNALRRASEHDSPSHG